LERKGIEKRNVMALTIESNIIPQNNINRPGLPMQPIYITIHETANTNIGADSYAHYIFLRDGGGPEHVSFHYCVDDKVARQLIPDNENAWHAGDGYDGTGNRKSIAIETCVNADGDWNKTLSNLVELIAELRVKHNIPSTSVVQHNHWSEKDCPHIIRIPPSIFGEILRNADKLVLSKLGKSTKPVDYVVFNVPGYGEKWIINEIYSRYAERTDAIQIWGLPLTGMFEDHGNEVQIFERAIFRHKRGSWPEKYDTLLLRIGYSIAQIQGYISTLGETIHPMFMPRNKTSGYDNEMIRYFDETHHYISYGFKAYWEKHGGIEVFGYPISEEFTETLPRSEKLNILNELSLNGIKIKFHKITMLCLQDLEHKS
jgi:N-acetylmuramoyl-L-alanine amidase